MIAAMRRPASPALLCAVAAMAVLLLTGGAKASPYNNYVLLAQAFLHGHIAINWPGPYIDALEWNGARYIIEAPLSALLLIPFAAMFGGATNQTLLGVAYVGIAMGAYWTLLERIGTRLSTRVWLSLFAFAGTDLWWCASIGDVWQMAHLGTVAPTMLALCELSGKRRPWLVALWACLAAASRFSMVAAIPVYAWMLLDGRGLAMPQLSMRPMRELFSVERLRAIGLPFTAVIAFFGILWVRYNLARWGTPWDIGYTEWYHADKAGSPFGSPFQLRYFGYECYSFFAQMPTILPQFPWLEAGIIGQSLTFTSPALVLAGWARGNPGLRLQLWTAALLTAIPSFFYYVNGFAQFGMRHALDFEPYLFVLMGLSTIGGRRLGFWARGLILWSALVGCWGVWYWHGVMGR